MQKMHLLHLWMFKVEKKEEKTRFKIVEECMIRVSWEERGKTRFKIVEECMIRVSWEEREKLGLK